MRSNWINNRAIDAAGPNGIDVYNPATQQVLNTIPVSNQEDVDMAVGAAAKAKGDWGTIAPAERRSYLLSAADRIEVIGSRLAEVVVAENGKTLHDAKAEVSAAISTLRNFAELALHLRAGSQQSSHLDLIFQHREPRGIAACILPWNYPLLLALENIAPNLAVGNTVVIKPSEKTPLSTRLLVEEGFAELPPGVCNCIHGDGSTGKILVEHRDVDLVVFVGSRPTGQRIGAFCGQSTKKAILELGSVDPLIIDENVNIEKAIQLAADTCFANAGQICTSAERIYVHENVYESVKDGLVQKAKAHKLGNGMLPDTTMGPLIDGDQISRVMAHVEDAVANGATIECGHRRLEGPGFFYEPTVLTGIKDGMKIVREETFGPVAPLIPFRSWDDAIRLANMSEYGLGAVVCTDSGPNAIAAIKGLEVGMLKINTTRGKALGATSEPYKNSGMGYGYGVEFLQEVTRQKSVHWRSEIGPLF